MRINSIKEKLDDIVSFLKKDFELNVYSYETVLFPGNEFDYFNPDIIAIGGSLFNASSIGRYIDSILNSRKSEVKPMIIIYKDFNSIEELSSFIINIKNGIKSRNRNLYILCESEINNGKQIKFIIDNGFEDIPPLIEEKYIKNCLLRMNQ